MSRAAAQPIETDEVVRLPGGDLPYTLRRSPRARRLRVVIHPERGVVVTLPAAARLGRGGADRVIREFLGERELWLRRHLDHQAATRARLDDRPPLEDGRLVPYLGAPHRVRVVVAPAGVRATRVSRVGGEDLDELLVEVGPRDGREPAEILEAWFRERARIAIGAAVERHAVALSVSPSSITIRDTTSRWGSCSRAGALSFSWRLVLAPPGALDSVAAHEACHLRVFGHGPKFWALLETRVPDHATWRRWLKRHAPELHAALD
ncbi:MAG: M48 family metallopeptidase [Candidatus Limnocylindrales bacterium]